MRPNGYVLNGLAAILGLWLLLSLPALSLGASQELQVTPDLVEIGTWFRGHQVTASAMIPRGAEAVFEIVGQTADEHLMRKGRRGGLWMNVGEIEVQHAPSLYMILGTDPKLLEAAAPETPWGFAALKRRVTLVGAWSLTRKRINSSSSSSN